MVADSRHSPLILLILLPILFSSLLISWFGKHEPRKKTRRKSGYITQPAKTKKAAKASAHAASFSHQLGTTLGGSGCRQSKIERNIESAKEHIRISRPCRRYQELHHYFSLPVSLHNTWCHSPANAFGRISGKACPCNRFSAGIVCLFRAKCVFCAVVIDRPDRQRAKDRLIDRKREYACRAF